jgi:hypothetical protein
MFANNGCAMIDFERFDEAVTIPKAANVGQDQHLSTVVGFRRRLNGRLPE